MTKKKAVDLAQDLDLDIETGTDAAPPVALAPAPAVVEVPSDIDPEEWGGEHVEADPGLDRVALSASEIETLAVDPRGLTDLYTKIPAQIALQGKRLAQITAAHNVARGACKNIEAALDPIHRRRLIAEGSKPTVDAVSAAVQSDPRLRLAKAKTADLDKLREEEWAIMEGLRAKLSTSIAIGQLHRAELMHEPRVFEPSK